MGPRANLACVAAIAALAGASPGHGQAAPGADETRLALEFDDAEISKVVEAITVALEEPILFDDTLRGRVTISVSDRVTVPEALEILNAALLMKGYAVVPARGGFRKIVPIQNTATEAPWTQEPPGREREGIVTTMVRIRFADPGAILDALGPLLAPSLLARAYLPTRSLILAGTEARLHRLLTIVQALDQAEERHRSVLRLRYRGATEVSEFIKEVFAAGSALERFELVVDERSNALIVEASRDQLDEIRAFVRDVDTPIENGGDLHVVPAIHADAERLAELIRELGSGASDSLGRTLVGRDYSIVVDRPTNSLVVRADPETFRVLTDLIHELDQMPPSIVVEALVVEVTTSDTLDLALDALIPFGAFDSGAIKAGAVRINTSGTNALQEPTEEAVFRFSRLPLLIPLITSDGETIVVPIPRESVVVLSQERKIYSQILLNPHLMMASGDERELQVGDNIPIPVSRATTEEALPISVQQNIERHDVGVNMRVLPTVGVKGGVNLSLDLAVSRLAPSRSGDTQRVGPTIEQRKISATFPLQHGQVAVIGSHEQQRLIEVETRVPFLADIPVLGAFFKSINNEALDTHLVIAVQARLLRTPADQVAETIRRRLAFERHVEGLERLRAVTEAPYALLVTTRVLRRDAEAIAETVSGPDGDGKVVAWGSEGRERFEVYLTGFRDLSEVANAALRLRDQGWSPSVVVVPGRPPAAGMGDRSG